MNRNPLSREHLLAVAARVGGWHRRDYTRVRATRDPVPWYYAEIVRRYLRPTDCVLDIGTGSGRQFLSLARFFAQGVGIDPDEALIQAAQANLPPALAGRIAFLTMPVHDLHFPDESFDVVLNRQAIIHVDETVRVLRPGGLFITQQVGPRNAENITRVFGCTASGQYRAVAGQDPDSVAAAFQARGCAIVCRAEYNVPYYYTDLNSLVFWLQAVPLPEDFDMARHWEQVAHIAAAYTTPRGIATNEHRLLLIVRKAP